MARQHVATSRQHGDGHLWWLALGLAVVANAAILTAAGFIALKSAEFNRNATPAATPAPQVVALIFPEMPAVSASPAAAPTAATPAAVAMLEKRFARTAAEQAGPRPDKAVFFGERDTIATSDRAPDPSAPPLPSQSGIVPPDAAEIETTHSTYHDGSLAQPPSSAAAGDSPRPPAPPPAATPPDLTENNNHDPDRMAAPPPAREKLLDGPRPVDEPVARESPTPAALPMPSPAPDVVSSGVMADPKPQVARDPGFRGFQRKTAVIGSISRSGRSALDVADSPLGRYQAAISRAVEQEWQRNCVRHRDFITPGFLTVRFFVGPSGKVRSVQFVGDMETGEVQKGFTLNSIRDAGIPAMPPTLRKEYDTEPLELIFRFYF